MRPAPQQPSTHRRHAAVENADQGMFMPPAQAVFQFQIATAGGVQNHAVFVALDPDVSQMRQGATLGVLDVLQQAASGGYRHWLIGAAKAVQIADIELCAQSAAGAVRVEVPRRLATQAGMLPPRSVWVELFADQQFRRFQPFQFVEQRRFALHLHDGEPAAA